jgi:ATP-dependent HslUV protease ATP-binding subunit HslU
MDEISFDAPDLKEKKQNISSEYVKEKLTDIIEDEDLSRYIL